MMHHIYPITLLDEVDKIMVVRDTKGPEIDKVQYYCPPNWTLKIPIFTLLYKFVLMINLSIREKPELIHSYLMFPHGILAFVVGMLTRRKIGISLIAGPVELYAPGRSPIGKFSYCNQLPPLSHLARILLFILNKCDIITVTGSYTKKFLEANGLSRSKVFILPHTIDNRFKVVDMDKMYDIIFIGRLSPVKHVETLIKSIGIVIKSYPNIKVAIVGDGECKTQLEHLSEKRSLSKNIVFTGYQSDVWNWYNKGKISVLTSEREGFPYSVIEALSCGLPVIASGCGNVCDVIKNEYNGVIVDDYQDYKSFAKEIIKLLNNPFMLSNYSRNSLEIIDRHSPIIVAEVWKSILV